MEECTHPHQFYGFEPSSEFYYDLVIKGTCPYFIQNPKSSFRHCERTPEKLCDHNCSNTDLVEACYTNGTQLVEIEGSIFANKYCALCASNSGISEPMVCHSSKYEISPEHTGRSFSLLFTFNPSAESGVSFCDVGYDYHSISAGCQPSTQCTPGSEFIHPDIGCNVISCYPAFEYFSRKESTCVPNCNENERIIQGKCESNECEASYTYINKFVGCCPNNSVVVKHDNTLMCQQVVGVDNVSSSQIEEISSYKNGLNIEIIFRISPVMYPLDIIFDYMIDACEYIRTHLLKANETPMMLTLLAYTGNFIHATITTNSTELNGDEYFMSNIRDHFENMDWFPTPLEISISNLTHYSVAPLKCAHVVVNWTEWEIEENKVSLKSPEVVLDSGVYSIRGTELLVCYDALHATMPYIRSYDNGDDDNKTRNMILEILTLLCMTLSAIGLIIRIICQFFVQDFQTFPMILQCIFCSALLLSVILFLLLSLVKVGSTFCIIYSICMHYAFLSSFTWMSIVSFDMFRVFRAISNLERYSIKPGWKVMLRYQLMGWGIPFVLVLITLAADFLLPTPYNLKPKYGQDNCWLSPNGYGVLIYFGVPVFMLIIFNCIIFIATSFALRGAFKQSRVVRNNDQQHWKAYVKLFVVMGFSYILVLLTPFIDHIVLWIFIIILNSSQGVFICIAFVCKKKIVHSLSSQKAKKTKDVLKSNGTHNTSI